MQETQVYEDIQITCRDCKKVFVFTIAGQKFFEEKGFQNPVRCKVCRFRRKAEGQKTPVVNYQAPHDN